MHKREIIGVLMCAGEARRFRTSRARANHDTVTSLAARMGFNWIFPPFAKHLEMFGDKTILQRSLEGMRDIGATSIIVCLHPRLVKQYIPHLRKFCQEANVSVRYIVGKSSKEPYAEILDRIDDGEGIRDLQNQPVHFNLPDAWIVGWGDQVIVGDLHPDYHPFPFDQLYPNAQYHFSARQYGSDEQKRLFIVSTRLQKLFDPYNPPEYVELRNVSFVNANTLDVLREAERELYGKSRERF